MRSINAGDAAALRRAMVCSGIGVLAAIRGGRRLKPRPGVDGISNTVHPFDLCQPLDGELAVQIAVNGLTESVLVSSVSSSSGRALKKDSRPDVGSAVAVLGIGGERPLVEDARDGAAASLRRSSPDLVLARRPWAQPPRQGDAPPVGRRARPLARTASLPSLAPACLPAASSGRWIKGRQSDTGIAAEAECSACS